jgi:hypothetical protein
MTTKPGERRGGRQKGVVDKYTAAILEGRQARDNAARGDAAKHGWTVAEGKISEAAIQAEKAAPYIHPRLSALDAKFPGLCLRPRRLASFIALCQPPFVCGNNH